MTPDPEAALAEQAKTDPDSFAELFDRFYPRIFTYFRYRTGDDAMADDLSALVFERLLSALQGYRPERGPFAPWLFALARNKANDHWRGIRRGRQVPIDQADDLASPDESPEADLIACQEEDALLLAVGELPAREREILGLKFGGRFTNREIARMLSLGESHVGVLIYRSIRKLRTELEQIHE
jgi:RNA polymerase sigma-70 factor (ECF subfamily)